MGAVRHTHVIETGQVIGRDLRTRSTMQPIAVMPFLSRVSCQIVWSHTVSGNLIQSRKVTVMMEVRSWQRCHC